MHYIIDYDTRSVLAKSEDDELLAQYIINNQLAMAVSLVSNAEDLALSFSMREMCELYENLTKSKRTFDTEDDAGEICWSILQSRADRFPVFTQKLGTQLLRQADKAADSPSGVPGTTPEGIPTKAPRAKRQRAEGTTRGRITVKQLAGKRVAVGPNMPPKGIPMKIREYLELAGPTVFEDLITDLAFDLDKEEKQLISYITGGTGKGFLEIM